LAIARDFALMPAEEQQALLGSIAEEAGDGRYEYFKSTQLFDSKYHRQQHGFTIPN